MRVFTIEKLANGGDVRLWLTWSDKWSDEWPDARTWDKRADAALYLKRASSNFPTKYFGASVDETETEDSFTD